jgi:hypothetical protein
MQKLTQKIRSLSLSGRSRVALAMVSIASALFALVPSAAMASGEESGTSGSDIAKDFVEPLTTKFTEALPVIIGFLVLVAATVAIIKFVQSRGKSKTV